MADPNARVLKRIHGFGLQKRRSSLLQVSSWDTGTVPKEWLEARESKLVSNFANSDICITYLCKLRETSSLYERVNSEIK